MITIPFEITQDGYTLKDALVLPEDHSYTEQEVGHMKLQRFAVFFDLVTAVQEDAEEITEGLE